VQYYATFLGLSYRERIEMVMAELGRKFGNPRRRRHSAYVRAHSFRSGRNDRELAAVVGRIMTELIEDGEIERRERKYILLRGGGAIEAAASGVSSLPKTHMQPSIQPSGGERAHYSASTAQVGTTVVVQEPLP